MSLANSTIVRPFGTAEKALVVPTPPRPRGPLPLWLTLRALDAIAPRLAGAVAHRLWWRLPATPSAERRDRRRPVGGSPFAVRRDGIEVRGVTWGPDDAPTAILVHGWGGWWQQLGAFVDPLLAAGYRVVAYDAPSHGDSPAGRMGPDTTHAVEMAEALDAVCWQQGPADLVVAHSLGAMSTLVALRDLGTTVGALAFIAPGTSVEPMVETFGLTLGLGRRAQARIVRGFEGRLGRAAAEFRMVEHIGAIQHGGVPSLLVLHDRGDHEVPAQGSAEFASAWPGSDLVLTDGLGHRRVLWSTEVVAAVADFARTSARRP